MADLSIEFAGVRFKNPLLTASADHVSSLEKIRLAVESGLGGITMKSATEIPAFRDSSRSRMVLLDENGEVIRGRIPRTFYFCSRTNSMTTLEQWAKLVLPARELCRQHGVVLIASLAAGPVEQWVENARFMASFGIDMLELNLSCPHSARAGHAAGMQLGQDPAAIEATVRAVTGAIDVPVVAKLTPQATDVLVLARAALEAGAAGVTLTNRLLSFSVDVETGLPICDGWVGIGGPWVKPLTLRWVSQSYRQLSANVIGSGGVGNWRDAVEFLMSGSRLVQLAIAIMLHGYGIVPGMLRSISDFMDRKGYRSVEEMLGIAAMSAVLHSEIPEKLARRRAAVDPELCTGCGACVEQCLANAMSMEDGTVAVAESCIGCGLCVALCPQSGALEMVDLPR